MCNGISVREDSPSLPDLAREELGYLQGLTIVRYFGFLFEREKSEVKGQGVHGETK